MVKDKDYYLILGVPRQANRAEIKSAYRRLARAYHPDAGQATGDSERFRDIFEAYQTLINPEARRAHDRMLDAPAGSAPGRAAASSETGDEIADLLSLIDKLFESWERTPFGMGGSARPADLSAVWASRSGRIDGVEPEENSPATESSPPDCPHCRGRSGYGGHICLVCFNQS